jgi:hypothetical protein
VSTRYCNLIIFRLLCFYRVYFRVWKGAGLCTHILEGHSDGVTSVSVFNPEGIKGKDFPPHTANLI